MEQQLQHQTSLGFEYKANRILHHKRFVYFQIANFKMNLILYVEL